MSGADQPEHSSPPADLDTLVHLYGDAMQRIGRLESQIERLSALMGEAPALDQAHVLKTSAVENPGLRDLLERLQILEDQSADAAGLRRDNGSGPGQTADQAVGAGEHSSEVAQIRAQLAQAQKNLQEVQGHIGYARHRRRRKRGSWWRLWGRK